MIEVKNLSKNFNGFTVLKDINFTIEKGEIFAYLGPNGAGKSTTVNILVTLLKPTNGRVKISGYDVTKNGMESRRIIGFVQEDFGLYPYLTVFQNLDFVGCLYHIEKKQRREKINDLLIFFDLWNERMIPASSLSKGMKQKLCLARALIHDPKILFLDEPTSGLDPLMSKEVLNLILKLKTEEKTIFMTTHLLSRAEKVCDSIALLNKGKILCIGKLTEIKTKLKSSSLEDVYFEVIGEAHG